MGNNNTSTKLIRRIDTSLSDALTWVEGFFSSLVKFTKASILSLLIILVILLLLTKMEQAYTMFIDLIEGKGIKWELLVSFFMINALALALSHYPIYNYYAANLNNSSNYTVWREIHPFKWKILNIFKVYLFTDKKDKTYKVDDRAHYLRYSIGLLTHAVWILFIIKTFLPKFDLSEGQETTVVWIFFALCFVPLIHYIYVRRAVQKAQAEENTTAIYKRLSNRFTILTLLNISLIITCVVYSNMFSRWGFFLLVTTCYLFMFNYLYFRLLRTKLNAITNILADSRFKLVLRIMRLYKKLFYESENYLLSFSFYFLFALLIIIWTTVMAILVKELPNGMPILLAFFYAYYFALASLGKFFFAYRKLREQKKEETGETARHTLRFKLVCILLILFIVAAGIGMSTETKTHQLDLVDHNIKSDLTEEEFINGIRKMEGNSVFFIASHGGGLKSNAWTLHVLEKLHLETKGELINHTIALSGASGGSLGLALFTGLSKEFSGDFKKDSILLEKRIDIISKGNYTSSDLALTFGIDTFRKLWPLNQELGLQDRPYYAMIKYQNYVEDSSSLLLSEKPFRNFWRELYDKNTYYPSLIMNTAATTGKRGILWSVKANNFDSIFHFSEDLAELKSYDKVTNKPFDRTLSYYEAVSTTNRFPIFSPAAKIPGYGHYIDAGAIDNSGMLGCLDLFLYLQTKDTLLAKKKIVFVEIINSKTLYVDNLLKSLENGGIEKDENETDNIIADMQTALNLDKIPGYVSDFVDSYKRIKLIKIFMPHKVTIGDVESYINGSFKNKLQRDALNAKLIEHNNYIDSITEVGNGSGDTKKFFKEWTTYEPTLSRHLSESSLLFIKKILTHKSIENSIKEIQNYLND
jgi:hypothetical protein